MKSDPELYEFWPYRDRPKITWPNGARVAFWAAPNLEFYELDPPANPHRRAWPRPHPDVVGYAHRDYANRVGHWRMMAVMDRYGVPGSVSLSVALCDHLPEVVRSGVERGWEFFSHGIYNTRYAYGMDEAQERAIIEDSIATVERATGQRIAGWLAPALTHTERTMELLAEYGFLYTCDLFQDDQPQPLRVKSGRLISMPYSLEVNDHYGFFIYNMSPRAYALALKRQFDRLYAEGERSGTVMCIPLHSYLIGQPHRIGPFEEVLEYITGHDGVWVTTARRIAEHFHAHHYDAIAADIPARKGGDRA